MFYQLSYHDLPSLSMCTPFFSIHYFLLELEASRLNPLNLFSWVKCSTNCTTTTCQVCQCVPFSLYPLFSPGVISSWIPSLEPKFKSQLFYQLSYHHLPSLSMCTPLISIHYFLLELEASRFNPLNLGSWVNCSSKCTTTTGQVCQWVLFSLWSLKLLDLNPWT
jgi:hypothetical protein